MAAVLSSLSRGLRGIVGAVVAFPLPPRCPGCGVVTGADHSFCLDCWNALDFLGGPGCAICAEPLELALHPDTACAACLADPPPFAGLHAAVAYGPIARALALKLKYGRRPGIARTMARLMRRGVGKADGALLVPVPLHATRLWWRGYNQAALIARALARETGAELAVDLLRRSRATPSLRGLDPGRRRQAVRGAFAVTGQVRGRRVILVDDVYTTGATARACARALVRAGASEVRVACWARVVHGRGDER